MAKAHEGYANGSAVLDRQTLDAAVRRLLSSAVTKSDPPLPDGTVVSRTTHETDPPADFQETRTVKRPGPLPALVQPEEIKKDASVLEHTHEAFLSAGDDLDVWCYALARWAVVEARRIRARGVAVRSVLPGGSPGSAVVRVAFLT